jgi:trehalose synthase
LSRGAVEGTRRADPEDQQRPKGARIAEHVFVSRCGSIAPVDDTVPIDPGARRLNAYDAGAVAQLRELAAPLGATRVLFVTAAPFAPAAVDELRGVVPLLRALGIDARWRALTGGVAGARAVCDALRGGEQASADAAAIEAWRAQRVDHDADVVVACGAEALPALEGPARRLLRVHGRLGEGPGWELANGATVVAEDASFVPGEAMVVAPGVDPQSPRQLELPLRNVGHLARGAGLDLRRPLVAAVFDLDADALPEDAVDVFEAARARGAADLQLALCARVAHGDERAWQAIGELTHYAQSLDGVRVITDVAGHGDGVVNAVQRLARAAIAVDQGWGLPVAEALLKGTPVVAPPLPAATALLDQGIAGTAERGQRVHVLLDDPGLAAEEGRAGAARVREGFLVTRVVRDLLGLLA